MGFQKANRLDWPMDLKTVFPQMESRKVIQRDLAKAFLQTA